MRVEHNDLCIPPHHVFVNINCYESIIPSPQIEFDSCGQTKLIDIPFFN